MAEKNELPYADQINALSEGPSSADTHHFDMGFRSARAAARCIAALADERITSLEAECAALRKDDVPDSGLLRLVCDIRFAIGDDGKRMQAELVEHLREISKNDARYRWAIAQEDNAEQLHAILMCHGGDANAINTEVDAARAGSLGEGVR